MRIAAVIRELLGREVEVKVEGTKSVAILSELKLTQEELKARVAKSLERIDVIVPNPVEATQSTGKRVLCVIIDTWNVRGLEGAKMYSVRLELRIKVTPEISLPATHGVFWEEALYRPSSRQLARREILSQLDDLLIELEQDAAKKISTP